MELIVIRKGKSKLGEPIILHKKPGMKNFTTRLTFTSNELRDNNLEYLKNKTSHFKAITKS